MRIKGGAHRGSPFFFSHPDLFRMLLVAGVFLLAGLDAGIAAAQSRTRIWSIEMGTPVAALPGQEFVDPACGTNGGPPGLPLTSFEDFAQCLIESATGLREVWFIYDDEWEYIARAQRDEMQIPRYSANSFYRQPIITSLMIDAAGLVQGYRIITDPRAPADVRIEAYMVAAAFKNALFGQATWSCIDQPPNEREQPVIDVFVKQTCVGKDEGFFLLVETRHLFKPGQDVRINPRNIEEDAGPFESSTRLDVYSAEAVKGAPCCPASALP